MKNKLPILIALFLVGCQYNNEPKSDKSGLISEEVIVSSPTQEFDFDPTYRDTTNFIVDSINIGAKTKHKIHLVNVRTYSGVFVEFDFFKKLDTNWQHTQSFTIEKDGISNLEAEFKDFNNDGYGDLIFRNGNATRGANVLTSLLIFDEEEEQLLHIKNSENYPNLKYNKRLDCLDTWLIYGGSTTLFLKIDGDSLKPFAGVSLLDTRRVYTIDKYGNEHIIEEEILTDKANLYTRYSNYSPLQISEVWE